MLTSGRWFVVVVLTMFSVIALVANDFRSSLWLLIAALVVKP